MANTELQLEVAMRDQIIHRQRDAQRNLWNMLMGLGLDKKRLLDLAAWQGIPIQDYMMTPYMGFSNKCQSPSLTFSRYVPSVTSPYSSLSCRTSPSNIEHYQSFENRSFRSGNWNSFCREEHHTSYYFLSNDPSPSAQPPRRNSECWVRDTSGLCFDSPGTNPQNLQDSYAEVESRSTPCESCSSGGARNLGYQHEVCFGKFLPSCCTYITCVHRSVHRITKKETLIWKIYFSVGFCCFIMLILSAGIK